MDNNKSKELAMESVEVINAIGSAIEFCEGRFGENVTKDEANNYMLDRISYHQRQSYKLGGATFPDEDAMDYLDGPDADLYIALEYLGNKVSFEDHFEQHATNINPDGVTLQYGDEGVVKLSYAGVLSAQVGNEEPHEVKVDRETVDLLSDYRDVKYGAAFNEMKEHLLEKSSYLSEDYSCQVEDAFNKDDFTEILLDIQDSIEHYEDELDEAVNNNSDDIDYLNKQHDECTKAEQLLTNAIDKLYSSPRRTMRTEVGIRPPSI